MPASLVRETHRLLQAGPRPDPGDPGVLQRLALHCSVVASYAPQFSLVLIFLDRYLWVRDRFSSQLRDFLIRFSAEGVGVRSRFVPGRRSSQWDRNMKLNEIKLKFNDSPEI